MNLLLHGSVFWLLRGRLGLFLKTLVWLDGFLSKYTGRFFLFLFKRQLLLIFFLLHEHMLFVL